jgi:hypothetical protein
MESQAADKLRPEIRFGYELQGSGKLSNLVGLEPWLTEEIGRRHNFETN